MRACYSNYICKTDRFLSFTKFIISKAIMSAQSEIKSIVSEFNRQQTNPELSDDNLSSGGEEAALDQEK